MINDEFELDIRRNEDVLSWVGVGVFGLLVSPSFLFSQENGKGKNKKTSKAFWSILFVLFIIEHVIVKI